MASPEYRLTVTIPGLPVEDEDRWSNLVAQLRADDAGRLGAALGWHAGQAEVTVSLPASGEAEATRAAVAAITHALESAGLSELYPSAVVLEQFEQIHESESEGDELDRQTAERRKDKDLQERIQRSIEEEPRGPRPTPE